MPSLWLGIPIACEWEHSQWKGSGWVNKSKPELRLRACGHIALRKSKGGPLTLGADVMTTQTAPAKGMEFGADLLN